MSDTTPTPRPDEDTPQVEQNPSTGETPLADETAREHATGEIPATGDQSASRQPDAGAERLEELRRAAVSAYGAGPSAGADQAGADHTDTAAAPAIPAEYSPVSASDHVAPEPTVPAAEPVPAEASPAAEPATDEPVAEAPAPAPVVPTPLPSTPSSPTYLNAPMPPKKRGNRGVGILIAILATIVYAAANAGATLGIFTLRYGFASAQTRIQSYVMEWSFWLPVAVFLAAFIGLIAVVNRGRWWGYIIGSLAVGVLVFAGYFAAALLTAKFWNLTGAELRTFTDDFFNSNITLLWVALAGAAIAREVVLWFGAWIAFHGQNTKRRYLEAKAAYDAEYSTAR
ncbi:MAG: hypothetical protein FWD85_12945 [Microbacteriaceae bacterium]|nr:hypothetical protein [Microbacteriaceae bacterium]